MRGILALGVWACYGATAVAGNILVIVADDVGVASLQAYGVGTSTFPSPHLNRLVSSGLLFENAWAMPVCSPTRACLMTGRFGFRTGVGNVIGAINDVQLIPELSYDEVTIPKAIPAASGAFGKWHLGKQDADSPNRHGFNEFVGSLPAGISNFYFWERTVNGVHAPALRYATTQNVDDAIAWIRRQNRDWFCYLSFNAGHIPLHAPPPWLHSQGLAKTLGFAKPLDYFLMMMEAMDTEIGRLLEEVDLAETTVIFVGDNGDYRKTVQPPFDPNRSKATVYEGGLWVPLIIAGRGVVDGGRRIPHMVNVVDLYATIVDLLDGNSETGIDSVSLVPYLKSPHQASLREFNYAEMFLPDIIDPDVDLMMARAIRNQRFKLVQHTGSKDELYDLENDRFERIDLIENPRYTDVVDELRTVVEELTGKPSPVVRVDGAPDET